MPSDFKHDGDTYTSPGFNKTDVIRIEISADQSIGVLTVEYSK
jgi:hypothetical protein